MSATFSKRKTKVRLTDAESRRRSHVWKHNGMKGSVALSMKNMQNIIDSASTTIGAKNIAGAIQARLKDLDRELVIRIDPVSF